MDSCARDSWTVSSSCYSCDRPLKLFLRVVSCGHTLVLHSRGNGCGCWVLVSTVNSCSTRQGAVTRGLENYTAVAFTKGFLTISRVSISSTISSLKAGLVSVFQIFNLWTSRLLVVPLVRELSLVDHSVSFLAGVCLFEFVPARFLWDRFLGL